MRVLLRSLQDDVQTYEAAEKKKLKAAEKKKAAAKVAKTKTPKKSAAKKPRGRKAKVETSEEDEDEAESEEPKKRVRSRTPAADRKSKTAEAEAEDEEDEEEETSQDDNDDGVVETTQPLEEESQTVAAPLSQPASYKSITLPESFSLSWVFMFLVCILSITVLRVVKDTDMKILDPQMQFNLSVASIVLEPMPALLAILAIMRYASAGATLYSSRVCGALVWLIFVDVFDKIDTIIPAFFDPTMTKELMVLFSLCMLLGFYGYALSADDTPHSPIVGMLTVAASGVVLSYFDMNPAVAPVVSAFFLFFVWPTCRFSALVSRQPVFYDCLVHRFGDA
jgi:cation transport ATPase